MTQVFMSLKHFAVSIGKNLAPRAYGRLRLKRLEGNFTEPELRLLPYLCDPQKTSLDIGASQGLYTAHLLRFSQRCVAFEPRPMQAADLALGLDHLKSKVSVESIALSDRAGEVRLRMLAHDLGRSTIEDSNPLEDEDGSASAEIIVPARRLDDYEFDNIGFIKIDVEGHELAVLKGGERTISRNRPSLLIEIEDRHRQNAIHDVVDFLSGLNYTGFFLMDERLHPLSKFDKTLHQDSRNIGGWKSQWRRSGIYINNFIFLPSERRESFHVPSIAKEEAIPFVE